VNQQDHTPLWAAVTGPQASVKSPKFAKKKRLFDHAATSVARAMTSPGNRRSRNFGAYGTGFASMTRRRRLVAKMTRWKTPRRTGTESSPERVASGGSEPVQGSESHTINRRFGRIEQCFFDYFSCSSPFP
jgi:hypothetical protein